MYSDSQFLLIEIANLQQGWAFDSNSLWTVLLL